MSIFRATMTALVLVSFTGATLPAAGQDVRRAGKTAHSTHAKKRAQVSPQAKPSAARGANESWMDHGSASGAGGGGGGY
jgi:hypothetical protein